LVGAGVSEVAPSRGEVWLVALGAARKGEIGKSRPAVVVSSDDLQTGSDFDLITVVPLTTARSASPITPAIPRGDGILRACVALCYAPRALVRSRFLRRLAVLGDAALGEIISARTVVEEWDEV
jgi:mRNA interferase MazF